MDDLCIIPADTITELRSIGEGAYGLVKQGFHTDLGEIAIKKVVAYRSRPKQLRKLKEEAKKLKELCHPNIVCLHGFIEESEQCGIVLEFCKYGSLYDLLESYECSVSLKIQFLYEIVLGMTHLHSQNPPVIHRDLKAANVLIGEDLRAKLADFGLSEWKTVVRSLSGGFPSGTVTHIPPEKWKDINFSMDTRCDVYSFGILIWEVIMEETPFKDAKEMQIQVAVIEGQRPTLEDFPKDVPAMLKTLVERCWSQNPDDRPAFSEIKQQLENELISKDSFKAEVEKNKENLKQQIHSDPKFENNSLPTKVNISKNHSCRQLEPPSARLTTLLQTDGAEDDLNKAEPTELNGLQADLQSVASSSSEQSNASSMSGQGKIPATVQQEDPISMINRKVYSIVDQQLGNNVVTDSVPFSYPDSKTAPSVHYKRETSYPNKEVPMSDFPLKGEKEKVSKPKKKNRLGGATTIIQKSAAGETVIHTNKVDGIQIGDRNVMYVGSGGHQQGKTNLRSDPARQKIIKGKLTFERTPLDEDSIDLLCQHLGNYWRPLGRKLGFSNGQLDSLDADYYKDGRKEVIHQMIRHWKEREGRAATTYVIGNALIEIGRPGTASMLCKSNPSKVAMHK